MCFTKIKIIQVKICMDSQWTPNRQNFKKRTKWEVLILSDLETYHKTSVIKTVTYWHKGGHINQLVRTQSPPKINSHMVSWFLNKGAKTIQWGKNDLSIQQTVLGKWISSHHTQNLKVNQKIKELNLGDKTIKLLEQNIREYLHNFESDDDFLDMTPKAEATEK